MNIKTKRTLKVLASPVVFPIAVVGIIALGLPAMMVLWCLYRLGLYIWVARGYINVGPTFEWVNSSENQYRVAKEHELVSASEHLFLSERRAAYRKTNPWAYRTLRRLMDYSPDYWGDPKPTEKPRVF